MFGSTVEKGTFSKGPKFGDTSGKMICGKMVLRYLARLFPVEAFTEETKEAIDYWRTYRGERIRIERVEYDYQRKERQSGQKIRYGVEGTVSKVMSLPPGFMLSDVLEYNNAETVEVFEKEGHTHQSQEHDKLFVTFQSIERIVFVDEE